MDKIIDCLETLTGQRAMKQGCNEQNMTKLQNIKVNWFQRNKKKSSRLLYNKTDLKGSWKKTNASVWKVLTNVDFRPQVSPRTGAWWVNQAGNLRDSDWTMISSRFLKPLKYQNLDPFPGILFYNQNPNASIFNFICFHILNRRTDSPEFDNPQANYCYTASTFESKRNGKI